MTDQKSAAMDFDRAISPITRADFLANIYEKKHVVVKRDTPDYYHSLLSLEDIDRAITSMGLNSSQVNLVKEGNRVEPEEHSYKNGSIDPVRVLKRFADGATIILPGLQRRFPQLAAFCRAVESVFSANLQTNIYFTPSNSQGFKTHYDSHDVIILQTHGSKLWRIYESPVILPNRSQSFKSDGYEPTPVIDEFVLGPGDMAYIPRGMVHDAVATKETSLHITTGILSRTWTDIILDAIAARALDEPAVRRSLTPGYANAGFDTTEARAEFTKMLELHTRDLDFDAAFGRFADDFAVSRDPVVPGQLAQITSAPDITLTTPLVARENLIYQMEIRPGEGENPDPDDATVHVQCYGNEITLPSYAATPISFALGQSSYTAADLPGDLDDDGKLFLVRRLVQEGLIMQSS